MANTTRRNWQMPLQQTDTNLSVDQERERYESGMRVSWGGIWSGVLVALGTMLLLSLLGLAVGIAAGNAGAGANAGANFNGNTAGNVSAGTVGTAAAIWSGISLLISLFLGGLASTRMARIWDRGTGMFHGALVWVLTLGTILYLGLRGLGLMGSAGSMGLMNNGASGAAGVAGRAAAEHATSIGWSPFIIAALSLLAALAGAAAGLRHLLDRGNLDRASTSGSTTTTTTTTTGNGDRDRDRY